DFQVTQGNAASVAALCARLEGIPLALELAAARARVPTPAQMVEWLDQRRGLLVARQGGRTPRPSSPSSAIEWSYQLLPPVQQRFYANLSVFRGSCGLDSIEKVCSALESDGCEPQTSQTLENLTQLRGHSLVLVEEVGIQMRYRLLETLREF